MVIKVLVLVIRRKLRNPIFWQCFEWIFKAILSISIIHFFKKVYAQFSNRFFEYFVIFISKVLVLIMRGKLRNPIFGNVVKFYFNKGFNEC